MYFIFRARFDEGPDGRILVTNALNVHEAVRGAMAAVGLGFKNQAFQAIELLEQFEDNIERTPRAYILRPPEREP